MMGVTRTRNRTMSQAPIFGGNPRRMLRPPTSEMTPISGTPIKARGAPCDAAYAIDCFVKSFGAAIKKINTYNSRPRSTIAPFGTFLAPAACETVVEPAAIDFLLSPENSYELAQVQSTLAHKATVPLTKNWINYIFRVRQEVCHSFQMSMRHVARSCRVACVLPLPAHWATSHEPLAASRRRPSGPGPHLGARTRSRRPVVSSPLPAVARFCRARPLTVRASSSRPTHGASRPHPAIRAGWLRRDGHLPSRRGTTASVYRHRPSRRPHRPSLAEPSRTAPFDNR